MKKETDGGPWLALLGCVILLALSLGMFTSTNSVFVKPVCESLGFRRGAFTFYRTIITIMGVITMPLYNKFIPKLGIRNLFLLSTLCLGAVNLGYSISNTLWHFYILAFFNGLVYNGINFMSVGLLINQLFDKHQGMALGIAYAGSGLGGAIMIPIVNRIIEGNGWRFAYRFIGLLGIAIMLPVILFLIKEKPNGGTNPQTAKTTNNSNSGEKRTYWNQRNVLLLAGTFLLIGMLTSTSNTHTTPYLTDLGYPSTYATKIMSALMVVMMFSKVGLGMVYDNWGVPAGNTVVIVSCVLSPLLALFCESPFILWLHAIVMGVAHSALSVPAPLLAHRYFKIEDFPFIFSICSMMGSLGNAISVPIVGTVYDMMQSYKPAWIVFVGTSLLMSSFLILLEHSYKKITYS